MASHQPYSPPADPATQSNYQSIRILHSHLDWTIHWDSHSVSGSVTHTLQAISDNVDHVVLDTSHLTIHKVTLLDPMTPHSDTLRICLGDCHPVLGSALKIHLPQSLSREKQIKLKIDYSTQNSSALGWLEPSQTASGRHPFLYSQCQAIHARSLLPVQDTPSVKLTYTAVARSYLPVLFSAHSLPSADASYEGPFKKDVIREYRYEQPIKIPSYLIAIAAGELAYKKMGERTGLWADPATIDAAYREFSSSTEEFLKTAEKIIGVPYDWGTYDVLVLPPSFPYGGMENSNLTFLTPSLLTGDGSLVDVVAHEISHSWFGNNVGCANWGSFWLNEGWTTYLERLILRELHGDAERSFSYIIGRKALADALKEFQDQPRFQQLQINYNFGEDPDQAFSTVPYDKGANFLLHLEETVGGLDIFLPYASNYVRTFKGKALDTEMWKDHLFKFYEGQPGVIAKLNNVDWQGWLHGRGLALPVQPKYDTSLANAAYELAARWDKARHNPVDGHFKLDDISEFSSNQIVVFLETLDLQYATLDQKSLEWMNDVYGLDDSQNQEVRLRWYKNSIKLGAGEKFCASAAEWVKDKGRMKFARPVYQALFKVQPRLAIDTFKTHASFYHPICRTLLARDLGLATA